MNLVNQLQDNMIQVNMLIHHPQNTGFSAEPIVSQPQTGYNNEIMKRYRIMMQNTMTAPPLQGMANLLESQRKIW